MSQERYRKEAKRWLQQARSDLEASKDSRAAGHYEWACFQAQQAAEKGIKAIWFHHAYDPWGHSLIKLLRDFPDAEVRERLEDLADSAKLLDKLYIPTRYPNGLPDATPGEVYTRSEAETASETAKTIIERAAAITE
mgnify:FL=1